MRIDEAGPRTRLLAAAAGWAIIVWLLALAGMGGRIVPLPADAAAPATLPAIGEPAAGRLGAPTEYAAISRRPLLSSNRRPQPFSLEPERKGGREEKFEFILSGVLITPGLEMAIVQPAGGGDSVRLRVGEAPESAPSWRLVAVSPRGAVFEGPQGEHSLELRSYDGKGGNAGRQQAASEPAARRGARTPPRPVAATPVQSTPLQTEGAGDGSAPPAEPDAVEDADAPPTPSQQMEAIRKRIEERREQLNRPRPQTP